MTTIAERAGAAYRMTRKTSPRPRLATLAPRLATADLRAVKPLPKQADPELQTVEHRAWRAQALKLAGYACSKCLRSGASTTLFADHIIERKDGGRLYDPFNAQILCGSCHTKKTAQARAERLRP